MEKDKKEAKSTVKQVQPKEGPVDLNERVKVKMSGSPYHEDGIAEMHPVVADKVEANGWGKRVAMIALLFMFALGVQAQSTSSQVMKKHFANTDVATDTITNTGTNYVSTLVAIKIPAYTTTIQANIVKISGTVAGTVTLQGSLDATNWTTVTGTATGVQTGAFTATNVASQSTTWTLVNNPFIYYRITWTGTGTMAATLAGLVWIH